MTIEINHENDVTTVKVLIKGYENKKYVPSSELLRLAIPSIENNEDWGIALHENDSLLLSFGLNNVINVNYVHDVGEYCLCVEETFNDVNRLYRQNEALKYAAILASLLDIIKTYITHKLKE
jgi:hypothetical protein